MVRIKKAEVLLRQGTDLVSLTTDKPYPFPDVGKSFLKLQFETKPGHGVSYCQEHFSIFPDIINTK